MASDIDELLEDLRAREAAYRDKVSAMITPSDVRCGTEKADRLARHIAAVETLVKRAEWHDVKEEPLVDERGLVST